MKIINVLPEQREQLQPRLLEAQNLLRRNTWKPLKPEEILQLVASREPSNTELSEQIDTIDRSIQKMADEPKITNNINAPNSHINAPIGTSGVTNSQVTVSSPDAKKGLNWGNLLTIVGIIVSVFIVLPISMSVSGAFNNEFKEWVNRTFFPKSK
jgi:hypothetical protein